MIGMDHAKRGRSYGLFEVVPIPRAIPELGIEAGARGTVVIVFEPGRAVSVEVVDDDGATVATVDLRMTPEPPGSSRVAGYVDERD